MADENIEREDVRDDEPAGDIPSIAQLLSASNWEERVAVARIKREEVLAKKAQDAANDPIPNDRTKSVLAAFPSARAQQSDTKETAPAILSTLQSSTSLPLEVEGKRKYLSGAWILVACCAALGFGISLGAGMVVGVELIGNKSDSKIAGNSGEAAISAAVDPVQSEVALVTTANNTADFTLGPINSPLAFETSVTKDSDDLQLVLPKADFSLNALPRTPLSMTLASAQSDTPFSLQSTFFSDIDVLSDISQPSQPNVFADQGGELRVQFAAATRVTFGPAATTSEVALLQPKIPSTHVGPAITVSYADPSLPSVRPDVDTHATLQPTNPVLAIAPEPEIYPPAVDSWEGVRTQPFVPSTLAAKLGYVGNDLELVNLKLHAPDGLPQEAFDAHAAQLETTGFVISKAVRPSFNISSSHLRYYNADDYEVAQAIATAMGFELRDFTKTNAPEGLVEVWLEGRALVQTATPQRRTTTLRTQSQPRRVDPVTQLRNSLANQLRNGDHL